MRKSLNVPFWVRRCLADQRSKNIAITAGYGCLRGSTKVHTDQGLVAICDITHKHKVLSFDDRTGSLVLAQCSGSFLKGKGNLYRVLTQQGEFAGAEHHRIFSYHSDYVSLSSLSVGDEIALAFPSLPESSLESCQLKFDANDLHLNQRASNFLYHYGELGRQYGRQLHEVQESDQSNFRHLVDVQALVQSYFFLIGEHRDALTVRELIHNHHDQKYDRHSMNRLIQIVDHLVYDEVNQILALPLERIFVFLEVLMQSASRFLSRHREMKLLIADHSCITLSLSLAKTRMLEIERLDKIEDYFDLSVPITHNYITEDGTIHHNSGKSHGSWMWLLQQMRRYPKAKTWGYCEPTYPLIDKVAIPSFRVVAESFGMIEGLHYSIVRGSTSEIRLKFSNQIIRLLSLERPEALVGFELCGCVVDEAALCRNKSLIRLQARMRGSGVPICQTLFPTTPEGLNDFSDQYDSDGQGGWISIDEFDAYKVELVHTELGVIKSIKRRIRLTTYSNMANLPPDYIASNIIIPYGHDQNYIDSYVYGFFRPFNKGLAYKEYKTVLHRTAPTKGDPDKILNLTWDFNICPQWVAIQEQIEFAPDTRARKKFNLCIDNANQDGETLSEAIAEFAVKFPVHKFAETPIHLYGDASGQARSWKHQLAGDTDFIVIKRILNQLGYRAVVIQAHKPPNPLERLSVEAVNTAFMNDALRVASICDRVLKSLSRTAWANNQKARLDKPANDTWTHPMDAVKYFIWAIDNKRGNLI